MRRFFRYVLRVLVLVVVFLISALTAMRFAIHGREAVVPKLLGLTPAECEQAAIKAGFVLQYDNRYFSSEVPAGRIMSQFPPAGQKVRRGWRLRISESMGPQRAVIPDVLGQSERAAELNIRRRGLDLGMVASLKLPGATVGTVVAQSPPANAVNVASPKVSLLIGESETASTYVMPDLVGMSLDSAIKAVTNAGFKVGAIHTIAAAQSPIRGVATILRQAPAAGQRITPDITVNVDVAR